LSLRTSGRNQSEDLATEIVKNEVVVDQKTTSGRWDTDELKSSADEPIKVQDGIHLNNDGWPRSMMADKKETYSTFEEQNLS
jgi:hypothetical protein